LEHITTRRAKEFVERCGPNVAATITPQHLLFNRNALFEGGLRPHFYCLPILKKESDRRALSDAIRSGSPKFFAGTDSAPHWDMAKHSCCGSAGCFTMPIAVAMYAQAFDQLNCLDKLRAFLCENGAKFYGLETNAARGRDADGLTLTRQRVPVPLEMNFGDGKVRPLLGGSEVQWDVAQRGV
jgi:dihydroorotase